MFASISHSLNNVGDIFSAKQVLNSYIAPTLGILIGLASLVATLFLVTGGISYMTSQGKPDKLEGAKKIIKNALIGLVLVIGAGALTAILVHAYSGPTSSGVDNFPSINSINTNSSDNSLVAVLINAIIGLLKNIVDTAARPFISALSYFTHDTPLMATNPSVFHIWAVMVVISNSLFVLVVALLGFHVMSASALGIDEIEFKHLLPQFIITFLLINSSIFIVDSIIGLSNVMVHTLYAAFPDTTVWSVLDNVTTQSAGLGLVALLIFLVFIILSVILLVYYVMRLVVLYLGAILAPLLILLWLIPSFKDFVSTATKTYLSTIFVLFIHVIILMLAASLFSGMLDSSGNSVNPLMAAIVGIATLVTLLKTQKMMTELSYVSVGPKAIRRLGSQFMGAVNYVSSKAASSRKVTIK